MKLNTKQVSEYVARVVDRFPLKAWLRWSSLRLCRSLKINFINLWLNKMAKHSVNGLEVRFLSAGYF